MENETLDPSMAAPSGTDERVYHVSERSVAEAVVEATADAANVPPTEITPLYEVVDPDVLEAIVSPGSGLRAGRTSVSFHLSGLEITVWQNGCIRIRNT
jgi:hypothetical protein